MQKNKLQNKKGWFSKSGLILIFCITLICAAAIILVSGSLKKTARELIADELYRFNNAQAHLAAESGLMIGTNAFKNGGLTSSIKINLKDSEITIELTEEGAKDGYVRIISTVRHAGLDYDKRVEWQVKAEKRPIPEAGGTLGYFPVFDSGDTTAVLLMKTRWREADIPRS